MPTLRDKIQLHGKLKIQVKDAITGKVLKTIAINNQIMFRAADVIVNLLAQRAADGIIADSQMYTMRMGSGSATPVRSDTDLVAPLFGYKFTDSDKVTVVPGELSFAATMTALEGNSGSPSYCEAGLFTKGAGTGVLDATDPLLSSAVAPRMFARQVHPAIAKTAAISLTYNWAIAFTFTP